MTNFSFKEFGETAILPNNAEKIRPLRDEALVRTSL